jgi:hypothetical protein
MSVYDILIGQKKGNLLILGFAGRDNQGKHLLKCICDCGAEKIARAELIQKGATTTCGSCYIFKQKMSAITTTHGLSHTKYYRAYNHIYSRVYNENDNDYHNYGGRGIKMCKEWKEDFVEFYNYTQSGQMPETLEEFEAKNPGKIATVGRICNNEDYKPGNIQWETSKQQNRNKRNTKLNEYLVKIILWKHKVRGMMPAEIFEILVRDYAFKGTKSTISTVTRGKRWTDINIDKEIVEFKRFGTINGVIPPPGF